MSLRTWFNSSPASGSTPAVSSAVAARTRRATARRSWRSRLGAAAGALSGGAGPVFGRTPVAAESLESRTLLTILVGGDEFYYRDFNDNVNRIRLEGNIRVEVVGAEVNEDNNLTLRNLAGRLYRAG